MLTNNRKMSSRLSGNEKFTPTNGATKKAAEILIDKPDKALSQTPI